MAWRSLRDDQVPSLGELQRSKNGGWVWLCCEGMTCGRMVAVALAPFVIRWGPETSSNVLRRNARCGYCGRKGVTLQCPSWCDITTGFQPFPVDRMSPSAAVENHR